MWMAETLGLAPKVEEEIELSPDHEAAAPAPTAAQPPSNDAPQPSARDRAATFCYVCLCDEGAMLINVCKCRWSSIHPNCLDRVVQEHGNRCTICKEKLPAHLVIEGRDATLQENAHEQQTFGATIWAERPIEARLHTAGSLYSGCVGLSLLMYATIILYQTEQPITSWRVVLWPLLVALSGLVVCAVCTRFFYLLLEVWCR